jgi:hypothetical protein
MKKPNSYDIVGSAVDEYFIHNPCEPLIAFFYQKYELEGDDEWEWHKELLDIDYGEIVFLHDFCEGQTCVKDLKLVPLSVVTEYYANHVLKGGTQ